MRYSMEKSFQFRGKPRDNIPFGGSNKIKSYIL